MDYQLTTRPTDGTCGHWVGAELRYCRAPGAVRYQPGMRCAAHDIRAALGLDPLPASPGIPALRGVGA